MKVPYPDSSFRAISLKRVCLLRPSPSMARSTFARTTTSTLGRSAISVSSPAEIAFAVAEDGHLRARHPSGYAVHPAHEPDPDARLPLLRRDVFGLGIALLPEAADLAVRPQNAQRNATSRGDVGAEDADAPACEFIMSIRLTREFGLAMLSWRRSMRTTTIRTSLKPIRT